MKKTYLFPRLSCPRGGGVVGGGRRVGSLGKPFMHLPSNLQSIPGVGMPSVLPQGQLRPFLRCLQSWGKGALPLPLLIASVPHTSAACLTSTCPVGIQTHCDQVLYLTRHGESPPAIGRQHRVETSKSNRPSPALRPWQGPRPLWGSGPSSESP